MRSILAKWVLNAFALWIVSNVMSGISVSGTLAVFVAAAVIGLVNALLRPILIFLTIPIQILTLGLFTFVINGALLWLASVLVPGFEVHGFWTAVFGAIFLSIVSSLLNYLVKGT